MLSNFVGSVSLTSTNMDSDQGTGFNLLRYYQIWKWRKCFQHHLKKKKLQNNSILTWVLLLPCIILTTRWKNYVNAKGNILWYLFIIRSVGKFLLQTCFFLFAMRLRIIFLRLRYMIYLGQIWEIALCNDLLFLTLKYDKKCYKLFKNS